MRPRYYCALAFVCLTLTAVTSNTAKDIPAWLQLMSGRGVRATDRLLDRLCDAAGKRIDPPLGMPGEEAQSFADAPDNFELIVDAACQEDGRIFAVGWLPRDFSIAR